MRWMILSSMLAGSVWGADLLTDMDQGVKVHADGLRFRARAMESAFKYLKKFTTPEDLAKRVKNLEDRAKEGGEGIEYGFRTMAFNFFYDKVGTLEKADDKDPKDKEVFITASLYLVYSAWKNYDLPSQVEHALRNSKVVDKIEEFVNKAAPETTEK